MSQNWSNRFGSHESSACSSAEGPLLDRLYQEVYESLVLEVDGGTVDSNWPFQVPSGLTGPADG